MKTLVLNCGSSSIKYKLFDTNKHAVLAQGGMERVGLDGTQLNVTQQNGKKLAIHTPVKGHEDGILAILKVLTDPKLGCIKTYAEIDAVGHRVVHGGEQFSDSVLVTDEVVSKVKECAELAPLHNPANLEGIYAIRKILPNTPQVAVFDTAFHQTMPDFAYIYGLPYELYTKYGVRRYGFHGTSHRYVSQRACQILKVPYEKQRIITAHVGNGGSVAAIKYGKSVDTSMGLTPVEGLLMGTRCGDLDPGVIPFLMNKEKLDAAGVSELINKHSGVAGVSGGSSDMRELDKACKEGNARAILAMNMYSYRVKKYVGAYAAAMGGVDIIVFTGGVGENQASLREDVCKDMQFMGIDFDSKINNTVHGTEQVVSKTNSKVTVIVVPTDEELTIATDTEKVLKKK